MTERVGHVRDPAPHVGRRIALDRGPGCHGAGDSGLEVTDDEVGGRYSKYVLGVLIIVYVFNFIDRQILSILAEEIKADLGISDADIGFLYGTAFAVFYAVFEKGYLWLGVIGLVNGVISLYYYARIVAWMYLQDADETEEDRPVHLSWADGVLCLALTVPVVFFGIFWSAVWDLAKNVVPAVIGG